MIQHATDQEKRDYRLPPAQSRWDTLKVYGVRLVIFLAVILASNLVIFAIFRLNNLTLYTLGWVFEAILCFILGLFVGFSQPTREFLRNLQMRLTSSAYDDIPPEALSLLNKTDLFKCLSPDQFQYLVKHARVRIFQPGTIIFHEEDPGGAVYFIIDGEVLIFKEEGEGKIFKMLKLFYPGELFGEMALLDHKPRSASVKAMTPTTLWELNGQAFLKVMFENSRFSMSIMKILSLRTRDFTDYVEQLALGYSGYERVTRLLLELASQAGEYDGEAVRINLAMEEDVLAGLSNVEKETFKEVLVLLEEQGIVQMLPQNQVLLRDQARLVSTAFQLGSVAR